jgi:hypothetical protein
VPIESGGQKVQGEGGRTAKKENSQTESTQDRVGGCVTIGGMAKNEKTSKKIAKLASEVLSGKKKPTAKEAKSLAASVLTQSPDKPKKKKKG